MKKLFIAAVIALAAVVFCRPVAASEKRYEVKSGIVEYKMSGSTSGGETLYFDDWGRKEARYGTTTTKVMGFSTTTENVHIIDGEWSYSIDPKTNTASRINHEEMLKAMTNTQGQRMEYSEEMLKKMGGVKTGTESILGKTCDVWEISGLGTRVWEWKNVPLKSEASIMGITVIIEAVKADFDVKVEQANLALPEGIKVVDAPALAAADMQTFGQSMQAYQKAQEDPEFQRAMQEQQEAMKQVKGQLQKYQEDEEAAGNPIIEGATDSAQKAVQQEVNNATRQGVKKAFGRALNSFFGN